MIVELAGKLNEPRIAQRHRISSEDIRLTARLLRTKGILVSVSEYDIVAVTGDPEDDLVLATTRLGQADYLVTRDRRLLDLVTYASTPIVEPREFLSILARPTA